MSRGRWRNGMVGVAVGLCLLAIVLSVAVAEPGGWATWRVFLAADWLIPFGFFAGITYPGDNV